MWIRCEAGCYDCETTAREKAGFGSGGAVVTKRASGPQEMSQVANGRGMSFRGLNPLRDSRLRKGGQVVLTNDQTI